MKRREAVQNQDDSERVVPEGIGERGMGKGSRKEVDCKICKNVTKIEY